MSLHDEQLEMIPGEDIMSRNQRQNLEREVEALDAAGKMLRGG